jgi:hypothetical protein
MSQIGQYQVVALNRGTDHGMEPGHVLDIWQSGRKARDPYSFFGSKVQLPDVKAGTAMVFKTDTRLSYALVMSSTRSTSWTASSGPRPAAEFRPARLGPLRCRR